ncbi:MarR family winged helix-turn-helix transcriptional regulator [Kutzneria viridogrisea]|uniref:HTH marR-type domain-containing protein n=2 Tax=Kutzneria TaxID=43356 RepID=W5WIE2_9PSEU|nr:MarR family transcriptional regulator [Kutzneria albida]AHI00362.1 hypothetical protein KALB_7004 [Kutzneria albida DSM 43870]MBA8925538.1 DNA-binding MarR family transcriptional regulator [Kutzneria viridogrisea]
MSDATSGQLADLFLRAAKRMRHRWMRELAPLGLTPGQGRALEVLAGGADCGGPVRMAELAGRLGIVPRSATSVVDGLEEQGLAVRRPDPADRRSLLVSLTEPGRELAVRIDETRRLAAEQIFAVLLPEEREQLAVLLRRVEQDDPAVVS